MPEVIPTRRGAAAAEDAGAGAMRRLLATMTPEERQAFQEKQRKFFVRMKARC